ncbi:MAG: hypothetical protein LBU04_01730 [Christensenellaceae bacterium]|jgi:hypothetical protein|nr:hypothetical protein [Christensenellaceae bacterium]
MPLLLTYENTVRKEVFSLVNLKKTSEKNLEFTDRDNEHIVYYYEGTGNGQSGNNNKLIERTNLGYTVYYYERLDNKKGMNFSKQIETANSYGFKTFNTLSNKFFSAIAVFDYDVEKITDNANEENVYSDVKALIELGYKKIRPPKRKGGSLGRWTWGIETFKRYWNNDEVLIKNYKSIIKKELVNVSDIITIGSKNYIEIVNVLPIKNLFLNTQDNTEKTKLATNNDLSKDAKKNSNEGEMLKYFIKALNDKSMLVLEAFNTGVVGESILELNSEDGGNRNFIIVKDTDESIEGSKSSCEIEKERIRTVGDKIVSERHIEGINLDIGFRVLKLDTSNFEPVYYTAECTPQDKLDGLTQNIKKDRTPEDLLFEIMLDLGITLSSEIKFTCVAGKKVFYVGGDNLIACFDSEITKDVVAEIAKKKPKYAVFCDSSFKRDDIKVSFEQIFETYSKATKRKVI